MCHQIQKDRGSMGSRAGQESQGPARVRERIETGIFGPRACYHDRKSVSAESPKGSWFISPACVRSLSLPLGVGEALLHAVQALTLCLRWGREALQVSPPELREDQRWFDYAHDRYEHISSATRMIPVPPNCIFKMKSRHSVF